jgi:hypothetical protein
MTVPDGDPDLSALNGARAPRSADHVPETETRGLEDPLGMTAIVLGCIGIVTLGFVLAIITAIVATVAGQRARAEKRSLENAYIGFMLAALDGVVWIVLHKFFELNVYFG